VRLVAKRRSIGSKELTEYLVMRVVLLISCFAAGVLASATDCILDPSLPKNLTRHADVQPLCAGFLNACSAPYFARGDGLTDDSDALQAALNDAYRFRLAVMLPAGRVYVVSRQLRAVQEGKPTSEREYGFQLLGGRGDVPPTLKVKDGADVTAFPVVGTQQSIQGTNYSQRPVLFYALHETKQTKPNKSSGTVSDNDSASLYSAALRNIIIDLGNNPKLSGVSMSGAQLCSIEDVHITGVAFTAGVVGLPGSGGFSANLKVTNGSFGIWQQQFRPNPSVSGLVALNQTHAAVLLQGCRGPLVLSGFVVRSAFAVTAVLMTKKGGGGDGSLALEDGVIQLTRSAGEGTVTTAIEGEGTDITMRSVWVQSAVAVAVETQQLHIPSDMRSFKSVPSWSYSSSGVASMIAFAHGNNVSSMASTSGFPSLSYLPSAPAATPPSDEQLGTMHSWSVGTAQSLIWRPQPASPSWIDIVRDCDATPAWVNATDDDGSAIERCLVQHALLHNRTNMTVFVPRGDYLLWNTLKVPKGVKLVGAGRHNAALFMRPGSAFEAKALLLLVEESEVHGHTASTETATVVTDLVLVVAQRATALQVSAAGTLVRDLRTVPCKSNRSTTTPHCTTPKTHNLISPTPIAAGSSEEPSSEVAGVSFTGAASGHFFGLTLDHFSAFLVDGDSLLTVNGTGGSGGIHLYQLSAEHLPTDYQVGLLYLELFL
jgi:hypothetical protein